MLSCWNEDPEKRLTFSQLYRALKQLDGEIEVNCTQKLSDFCRSFPAQLTKTICAVVSPHPSFNTFSLDYSNTILYATRRVSPIKSDSLECFVLFGSFV